MAKDQTRRLRPVSLTADTNGFSALEKIADYEPADPDFTVTNGITVKDEMEKKQKAEQQAEFDLKTARDNAVAAEWEFHNFMLGAKAQVSAQYGDSSNEIQGLGLKKKTEYKNPSRKEPETSN